MSALRTRRVVVESVTLDEARSIAVALSRPDFRATAIIVGVLDPLSERARARILRFAIDKLEDAPPLMASGDDE